MQNIYDLIDSVSEEAEALVADMTEVRDISVLGLDPRAAARMWVNNDCVAVRAGSDRSLQYYGGFEYVDSDYRKDFGEFVFYLAEDSRVQDCIDNLEDHLMEQTG